MTIMTIAITTSQLSEHNTEISSAIDRRRSFLLLEFVIAIVITIIVINVNIVIVIRR